MRLEEAVSDDEVGDDRPPDVPRSRPVQFPPELDKVLRQFCFGLFVLKLNSIH